MTEIYNTAACVIVLQGFKVEHRSMTFFAFSFHDTHCGTIIPCRRPGWWYSLYICRDCRPIPASCSLGLAWLPSLQLLPGWRGRRPQIQECRIHIEKHDSLQKPLQRGRLQTQKIEGFGRHQDSLFSSEASTAKYKLLSLIRSNKLEVFSQNQSA